MNKYISVISNNNLNTTEEQPDMAGTRYPRFQYGTRTCLLSNGQYQDLTETCLLSNGRYRNLNKTLSQAPVLTKTELRPTGTESPVGIFV